MNLLQQALLDLWLGERDDLCVVGDDYQPIYAFTGAGPEHLLGVPTRFPHATVVRLEENYRSTPQVLALANRLVPKLGGAEKVLRSVLADGPEPTVQPYATSEDEGAAIVAAGAECPLEEVAILARTNARLTDFEELLHEARLPFQGASLLERDAARRLTRRLERSGADAGEAVRDAALDAGWLPNLPDKLGERELVRQTDLARLVSLAAAFDGDAASFVADLRRRFDSGGPSARGVNLLTLHRAKGLEFDVVFIPRLQEKELPSKQARTDAEIDEERRLFYVGMTRAKRVLWVTWSGSASDPRRARGASPGTCGSEAARGLDAGRRAGCARGASSVRARTAFRRTSSSTTASCTRSPTRGRRRSASCRRSRASARQSSSATATSCSPRRSLSSAMGRPRGADHQRCRGSAPTTPLPPTRCRRPGARHRWCLAPWSGRL